MTTTRTQPVHAPRRRLGAIVALMLALSTTILVAACGGGGTGGGPTAAPGETMGVETAAPTSAGY